MRTNVVHNCDCMDFMKDILDKHFDLAIVDPPYFDGPGKKCFYGGGKSNIYKKHYKQIKSWKIPGQKYYNELCRISKNQIIWGINYYSFIGAGAGRVVWYKDNQNSNFSNCEIAYNSMIKSVKIFIYTWDGFRQGNKNQSIKRIHPTQKPVALYKWLLKNYAKPGWKIFDSHVGSGSSRIACYDMGFEFTGCELDPDYWQGQEDRFKNHISNPELINIQEIQKSIYEQVDLD